MAKEWWEDAPLAQEKSNEWWKDAPLAQPPAQQAQDEWWKAAPVVEPPKQPQSTTSNPLIGMIGRTASLTGAFVDSVAEVAERVGDKLELAVPLSGISEEDIKNKKQLQPLFDWAKSLKGFDESLGYQPTTQLKELGSNPLNAVPFITERVITSLPDMVAAVRVPVAYIMARTKEILDERVKNDEKTLDDATVGDVTAAATAAVIESTLERFATKGLLKPTAGATKTGRVAKETGIQAGTETLEEEAAYLGEAAGTKKGLSAEEALTRGAEAAIVGGGLGAGVQGAKEVFAPQAETQAPPPPTGEQITPAVQQAAATPAPGIPGVDPDRVEQLTQTFVEQGLDPGRAQYRAVEVATREAEDQADEQGFIPDFTNWADAGLNSTLEYQLAKPENEQNQPLIEAVQAEIQQRAATTGEQNVGQTIAKPSGAGVSVAEQPGAIVSAEGLGSPDGSGVVSTRQDVAGVDERAPAQPVAVEGLNLTSIPYEFRSQAGQGQPVVTNTGENNIIDYSGRRIALVNINGVQVPFYLSTGSGGKVDVPAGKWYPFFGIGADGWINKTGGKEMAGYYGSEVLRNTAAMLDSTIGDIRNDSSIPKVGAYGAHIDAINTGFTPAENGTNATETTVRSNIDSLLNRLNGTEQVAPQEEVTTESELTVEDQAALQEELTAEQAKTDDQYAEEAEIPESVANVVGDLTTLPTEEEAPVVVAKGKTGPKGPRQTPEQKAASDERRKQQTKDYKGNVKAVDAAEAALNDSLADLKVENYGSDVELQEGVESQRIGKIQAIKSLVLLNRALKGTKLGDRVAELLKNPSITAQEIDNVK